VIEEFRAAFHIFDKDQDNKITPKELKMVLEHLGMAFPESELDMMFAEADPSENKLLSYEAFMKVMAKKLANVDTIESIMSGFRYLDKDNTGFISAKEFRYLMASYGEKMTIEEIQEMISEADPENTGKIKYVDFVNKVFGKDTNPPPDAGDKKDSKKDGKKPAKGAKK